METLFLRPPHITQGVSGKPKHPHLTLDSLAAFFDILCTPIERSSCLFLKLCKDRVRLAVQVLSQLSDWGRYSVEECSIIVEVGSCGDEQLVLSLVSLDSENSTGPFADLTFLKQKMFRKILLL